MFNHILRLSGYMLLLCIQDALVKFSVLSSCGFHSYQTNASITLCSPAFAVLHHQSQIMADEKAPINKQRISQPWDFKAMGVFFTSQYLLILCTMTARFLTSSGTARIFLKPLRNTTNTFFAPHRRAEVAQSNAVSPAPSTITLPWREGKALLHSHIPTNWNTCLD